MDSLRRAKASRRAYILHLNKTLNEVEALKPPVKDAAKVDALTLSVCNFAVESELKLCI